MNAGTRMRPGRNSQWREVVKLPGWPDDAEKRG